MPYIQYGQIHKGEFTTATNRVITYIDPVHCDKAQKAQPGEVIITDVSEDTDGVGKAIAWIGNTEVVTSQHCFIATPNKQKLNEIYLAYFFKSYNFFEQKRRFTYGSSIFQIYTKDLEQCYIPLPPLEVQQAIGNFLFQLEEVFASKTFGIEKEIELHKKQFLAYSYALLSLYPTGNLCIANNPLQSVKELEDIPLYSIGELCNIKLGNPLLDQNYLRTNHGSYPVYTGSMNGAQGYIDTYDYDGEYVTYIYSSAGCGETYYRNEKFSINKACHVMQVKDKSLLDTRYLAYIFNIVCKKYINPANGMAKLNSSTSSKIKIPVPPLHIQQQIANLLQSIENLVEDKTGGLKTELQLRTMQFKAYLDKFFS